MGQHADHTIIEDQRSLQNRAEAEAADEEAEKAAAAKKAAEPATKPVCSFRLIDKRTQAKTRDIGLGQRQRA